MRDPAGFRPLRGELFAAIAATGFGSAYVATALALRSFSPIAVAFYRSVVALLALVVLLSILRWSPRMVTRAGAAGSAIPGTGHRLARLLLIAVFGGPIFLASMNLAVSHVGATIASFVAGLYAILAATLAPLLLPERLTRRVLAGLLLALAGTALLAELDPASADRAGLAWGLLAAVSFALYLLLGRRWSRSDGLEGSTIAFATLAVSALALGTLVLVGDPASLVPARLDVVPALAIGWLAVVAVGGQLLTVASVRLVPAARTASFLLLNPITATILAALLVGERPSPPQLFGGGLVLAGIAAATIPLPDRTGRADAIARDKSGTGAA